MDQQPQTTIAPQPPVLGFGGAPANNATVGPSDFALSTKRREREQTPNVDSLGSMWRQDGLAYALVTHLVGEHMTPQPGYFAGTDPNFKELSSGLWEDNVKQLYQATSPAHAEYLKGLLLQKQDDMVHLGDLGVAGNVTRFAVGILSPESLLMGMAGGWVTRSIKMTETALAVRKAAGAIQQAEAAASVAANQAARSSGAKAVVGGVSFGAAENSAYESLRQSVNFEDDSSGVLEAGLMGAAFSAPFALAGVRSSNRIASAAKKEHEVLAALKAVHDGETLTVEQAKTVKEAHDIHTAIRDMESGKITPEELNTRLDEFVGPQEPDSVWLDRHAERIRQDGQSMLNELFPGRAERQSMGIDTGRSTGKAAPSEPQRASMDQAVALEDTNFYPKEKTSAAPVEPPKTAIALAMEKARGERSAKVMETEKLRKAFDLDSAMAAKGNAEAAARASEREVAFAKAEADRAADQERMINQRELLHAQEDPFKVPEAAPQEAPKAAPTQDFHADVGKGVTWAGPEGDSLEGVIRSYNPDIGKFVVETDHGMKAVHPSQLDSFSHDHAPSGFLAGSVGAAQVAKIASIANQRTAMSKFRLDYFAILNRSEHEGVRELAFKLAKDPIQVDKHEAQGWTASEHKKHLQRVIGGQFHREAMQAFREAADAAEVPVLQRRKFKQDFFEAVSKATRDPGAIAASVDPRIHAQVRKASTAMKEAYAKTLKEAQRAGVLGAKDIPPNDLYVNRQWSFDGIRNAELKHGPAALVQVLANAIKVPGLTGNLAKAESFLKVVKGLEFNAGLQNIHLQSRDMGTLRSELAAHGTAQHEIDDLVDVLFDARAASGGDAGQAGNLKYRFDLDETMSLQTSSGELRLDDLFENDSRVLLDRYLNSMAGHIGLAKVGIDSQATWMAQLRHIQEEAHKVPGRDGGVLAKELKHLGDIHAHITGRPMSTADFSNSARLMASLRGYTRGVMLGQLGLTAAFEMTRAASQIGFKAVFSSLPSFRDFIVSLRQGYIPEKGLAEDIMHMTGFGTEMASGYERAHELEGGMVDGMISRIEKGANTVSHTTDIISGNASFTSITRQIAAMAATKDAFDHAVGKKVLSDKMKERWVGQGLDEVEISAVLKDLKDHSVSSNDVLQSIKYEDWQKAEPETYEKFLLFVNRQVRDAIQDHDIGETMPWMHTTMGKVLAELRTFMLVAHAKQFLKTMTYRDATALQMFAISFVSECMAYSMQTAINYPNELEQRLSPEQIAKAATSRMSVTGLMPLLAESSYVLATGGDSLFNQGSTANTDSRTIWKTPSVITTGRLINALPTLAGMATGSDVTTKKEFQELWRGLPGSRLYGLPALGNYFSDAFPKSDPSKAYSY